MVRGTRANECGRTLENAVNDLLSEDYQQVSQHLFFALQELQQTIFTEQCHIGRDIYGKHRRVVYQFEILFLYGPLGPSFGS